MITESNDLDAAAAQANAGDTDVAIDAEVERQRKVAAAHAKSLLAKLPLLGPVIWLYMHASSHKHLFLTDIEWMIIPPMALNQYKLYMKEDAPLAYASWALVDEETENRLLSGRIRLAPKDWKSGDRLWLIDLVAPFGGGKDVLKDIRDNVFPSRSIKQLVPDADGKGIKPIEWKSSESGKSSR
jgi:cytolysin-activating lysine-acyltransferase